MLTFEELNKKPFFELVQEVLNFPNQAVECNYFICQNIHFTAQKQKENVEAILAKGIDPRKSKDCILAKKIIIEILIELNK